jgi:hypothetical protein
MISKSMLNERGRAGRMRWIDVDDVPLGRAVVYKMIRSGQLQSVLVNWPGSKRGRRLIDGDSLDAYLEELSAKQLQEGNVMQPAVTKAKVEA